MLSQAQNNAKSNLAKNNLMDKIALAGKHLCHSLPAPACCSLVPPMAGRAFSSFLVSRSNSWFDYPSSRLLPWLEAASILVASFVATVAFWD